MIDEDGVEGADPIETDVIEEAGQGEAQPDPVADLARELGWKPKEEWKGDDSRWTDARDFLKGTAERKDHLAREVRNLRDTTDRMARTTASLMEQQLLERDQAWQQRFNEAVEAGDTQAAHHAMQQRQELARSAPQVQPSAPPEGLDFAERNKSWFNVDQDATRFAFNKAEEYARQGISPARQVQLVEQDVRQRFPDLMPAEREPAKAPASVSAPTSRVSSAPKKAKGWEDIPAVAKQQLASFVERGVTKDRIAESYWKNNA